MARHIPPPSAPGQRPPASIPAADARLQAAIAMLGARQFGQAEHLSRAILRERPGDGNAANVLGLAMLELGRPRDARVQLNRATKAQPKNPFIAFNFARACRELGDMDKAAIALKKAARLKPDFAPAWNALGLLQLDRRDFQSAERTFSTALAALPTEDKARRAATLANLALTQDRMGDRPKAIVTLLDAMALSPDEAAYAQMMAGLLRHLRLLPEDTRLRPVLLDLFARNDINPRSLASVTQNLLVKDHGLGDLMRDLAHDPANAAAIIVAHGTVADLLADPLLLALIEAAPVTDVALEVLLTQVRRDLLLKDQKTDKSDALVVALARQGYLNEYVFFVSDQERASLKALKDENPDQLDPDLIARLACYEPLHKLGVTRESCTDARLEPLIVQQIDEPAREVELAACLETLSPLEDAVSLKVQAQYEDNPYPRWTGCDRGTPMPLGQVLKAQLPHMASADLPDIAAPDILIAGCGTGLQTMKVISSYESACVTAIDLSRASLAYGMRKLEDYGIEGVRHLHADILDVGELDSAFDVIESFGVIHHMDSPARALEILTGALNPGGVIFLGLYSEIGRQSVIAARNLIAERGYPDTPEGIRQARRDIVMEQDPELRDLLSPASDFWTTSDTRDLIFHVQEHRFTLLQVGELLDGAGLEFLGLSLPNPGDLDLFNKEQPDHGAARSPEAWHAFETAHPDIFGDTYRIWARKPG